MPGVKGAGGPPPKRSNQRRRRNEPASGDPTRAAGAGYVDVPEPDPEWHQVARRWFEALGESGQSAFYEPSDWATAALLAESMSRELNPQPVVGKDGQVTYETFAPKGASLAAWLKGMTSLLVTEGDRRRARLELERPVQQPGDGDDSEVARLDEFRRRLSG